MSQAQVASHLHAGPDQLDPDLAAQFLQAVADACTAGGCRCVLAFLPAVFQRVHWVGDLEVIV